MSSKGIPTTVPPWPSLYSPGIELLRIAHHMPAQPDGAYLTHPDDIFRFTLYWTLIFYTPIFLLCGLFAFLNITFPPTPRSAVHRLEAPEHSAYPLTLLPYSTRESTAPKPRHNVRRSRTTFALLVLLAFIALSLAGALLVSSIVGFFLTGLYKLAKFNMSTWIPFLWSVISVLVGLLSIWPSVIDII